MKISVKKMLCALTAAAMLFCAAPCSYAAENSDSEDMPELVEGEVIDDGNLVYTKTRKKGYVYVTSCKANLINVTVPNAVNDYKVLGIYDGAFAGAPDLTSVTIKEDVEYIGQAAFYECDKLSEVNIPDGVTKISDNCFFGCDSLEKIKIPETVTSLGAYSFAYSGLTSFDIPEKLENLGSLSFIGCKKLKEFSVSGGNSNYEAVDGVLYSNKRNALEIYPIGKDDTVFDVPESVSFIQPGAFLQCSLVQINMTDNVQWIGATAFSASEKLEKVVLSKNIAMIGEGLFSDCISLKSVDIPDSVTIISDYAFFGCNSLKSLNIPDSVETIGKNALGMTDDKSGKEHKVKDFELKASHDSAAGKYARENSISADYTDGNPDVPFIAAGIILGVVIIIAVVVLIIKKKTSSDDDDNEEESEDNSSDDDEEENESADDKDDENDENYNGNDIEA